jgi:pyridoxamine 5'-phosphate oxidase
MSTTPPRIDYQKSSLSESEISSDPFYQFTRWWSDAIADNVYMLDYVTLSTVDEHNHPDARVVLLKSFDEQGFVFYTNYESKKAQQLANNPHGSLVVFWPQHEQQIRLRGNVIKTSRKESEAYFSTRPKNAQIGSWASPQSQVISRQNLDDEFIALKIKFGEQDIPCPPHWGGFRLVPEYFEFWQGRTNRLHDRISYSRLSSGAWHIERLAP